MTLSTLNINTLITKVTDKYITESDYDVLRNTCILPTPVITVVTEIKTELERLLKAEQDLFSSQSTIIACKKQIRDDASELEQDLQQAQRDLTLIRDLNKELIEVNIRIRELEIELRNLNANIHRTEDRIITINHQIFLESQLNDHHTHSHQQEHPHPSHRHSHVNPFLLRQKNELSAELNTLKNTLRREEQQQSAQVRRETKITQQLNIEMPNKAHARKNREQAREARAKARISDDPNLLQLSQDNRLSLKDSINGSLTKLQKELERLMQKTEDSSYSEFINRLQLYLQLDSKLNHQEKVALQQITGLMQDYLVNRGANAAARIALNQAHTNRRFLQNKIEVNEVQLNQFKNSNPQLKTQNVTLNEETQRLEKKIAERQRTNLKLRTFGFIGLPLTGVTAGGAFLAMRLFPLILGSFTPLLFIPSALFGLASLGLSIAQWSLSYQNKGDTHRINANNVLVQSNTTKIGSQCNKISTLEQIEQPTLRHDLQTLEKNISSIDEEIVRLQKNGELILGNAKQVQVAKVSNSQSFFSADAPPPPYVPEAEPNPSAPPLDLLQDNSCSMNP